jgi:formylglycine-generating enzyme required for sulfatase activity
MQWRFFQLPYHVDDEQQEEFNRFLRTVKVLCVHREFVQSGENSSWALAVEYLPATSGSYRVKRGGSWNNSPANVRSANRNNNSPGNDNNNLGFRLALP